MSVLEYIVVCLCLICAVIALCCSMRSIKEMERALDRILSDLQELEADDEQ